VQGLKMSFGGLFDGDSVGGRLVGNLPYGTTSMPVGALSQPHLVSNSAIAKPILGSAGLSLGLVSKN
ncbi:hypothetical protein HPP92_007383, partial [Vanilla planifolia]